MTTITLSPNTVITMVGPSHSGKSTESKRIKSYLESIGKTCVILESDAYRKDMLHLDKSSQILRQEGFVISEIVFDKIKSDLNFYTSSPCNTDVVIVDTTGLDGTWRSSIVEIAKKQHYRNIAMIFTQSKELLHSRILGSAEHVEKTKSYVNRQLKQMREKVLPAFNKNDYMSVNRIEDLKSSSLDYEFRDTTKVLELTTGKYAIYGDVHQQVNSLHSLIAVAESKGFTDHILIGDYIDKDDKESLIKTVSYVHDMCTQGRLRVIKANHEEYVYRNLSKPSYVYELNDETKHFNSLKHFIELRDIDRDLESKFFEIYEKYTYDYATVINEWNYTYISHSPCLDSYLGKHSPKALKMARNTRYFTDDDRTAVELMGPILERAQSNRPIHIFGHVEVGKDFHVYKNKIAIDTGCVSGGHLTALLYDIDTGKKDFIDVKSERSSEVKIKDFSVHIKK